MKLVSLVLVMVTLVPAVHADERRVSCHRDGNRTYCDNGTSYHRDGNTTYGSDGSRCRRDGDRINCQGGK